MHPDWRDFLERAGAEFDGAAVTDFGNPDLERRAALGADVVCDLSHLGVLTLHGEDAQSFLQGQFTCDLREVTAEQSRLGAYCNPKGRVIAAFRLLRDGNRYLLSLPAALQEPVTKRLTLYRLMAKVAIEETNDALVRIGCSGPRVAEALADAVGAAPEAIDAVGRSPDGVLVVRVPGPQPRFECYGPLPAMRDLWTRLDVQAAPAGTAAWSLLDVAAGLPVVDAATTEAFLPTSLNLDRLDAVSYQKGCYPGQEVIARLRYRGSVKHRLRRAHVPGRRTPSAGDPLVDADGTRIGTVVTASPWPDGGQTLLAVLPVDEERAGAARWPDAEAAPLTLSPPFDAPERR